MKGTPLFPQCGFSSRAIAMLDRLGIKSVFREGLRVTDEATVEVVEMVLAGSLNKQIVGWISAEGGKAIGLCGKDGNMVRAKRATKTVRDPDSMVEQVVGSSAFKSALRSAGTVIGREITRSLFGTSRRRR